MKLHLDNSAFQLLSCDRKAQLRVIQGVTDGSNPAADFGSAAHVALELLDKGHSPEEMVSTLHKKDLNEADIPKAISLVSFFKLGRKIPDPIDLNGSPAVEIKFSYRYGNFILPNSAELIEVYLEGTIDRIHIEDDILVVTDYKTAADATTYLIDKKIKSYALQFQLPFYLYALKNFNILPASYLEYITENRYRLEIQLMFHNTQPPTFRKAVRHAFSEDFIDREVPLIINKKVAQYIELAQLTTAAPHTGMTVYKACDNCGYRQACLVMGTAREGELLARFPVKEYNPLTFR